MAYLSRLWSAFSHGLLPQRTGRRPRASIHSTSSLELGRVVAFKAIHASVRRRHPEREEMLRREAEAIAHLQHPNIVTLFDSGRSESGPYLILEFLHGEPLSTRLSRGALAVPDALRVAVAVSRALVHAHHAGVFHRDLKPANVFLSQDGTVKVLDFGLAHVFGTSGPSGGGTAGYMAPEQVRGEPEDARTDVYAVGVLLREMICVIRSFSRSYRLRSAAAVTGSPLPDSTVEISSQVISRSIRRMSSACSSRSSSARSRSRRSSLARNVTQAPGTWDPPAGTSPKSVDPLDELS